MSSKKIKQKKPKFEWDLDFIEDSNKKSFAVLSCIWKVKVLKEKYLTLFSEELFAKVNQLLDNKLAQKPGALILDFSSISIGNPESSSVAIQEMIKIESKKPFALNIIVTKSIYLPILNSILKKNPSSIQTLTVTNLDDGLGLVSKYLC